MEAAPRPAMLGDILVQMGCLDRGRLDAALADHRRRGVPLGRALVEDEACSRADLLRALSAQTGLKALELSDLSMDRADPALASLLPVEVARQHRVVPLRRTESEKARCRSPSLPRRLSMLWTRSRAASGQARLEVFLADDEALERALNQVYGPGPVVAEGETTLLLYGWPHVTTARLLKDLAARRVIVRGASAVEVMAEGPEVVVAPLAALEGLLPQGGRVARPAVVMGWAMPMITSAPSESAPGGT